VRHWLADSSRQEEDGTINGQHEDAMGWFSQEASNWQNFVHMAGGHPALSRERVEHGTISERLKASHSLCR
jgi:hypothetical protein